MGFMTNFKEPSLYIVELNEQLLTSHHWFFFHQFVQFLALFVSKLVTQTDKKIQTDIVELINF